MSDTLTIKKVNETYMQLVADRGLLAEIGDAFEFYAPGYKFVPSYRNGYWNGKIRMLSYKNNTMYSGLMDEVLELCKARGYNCSPYELYNDSIDKAFLAKWYDSLVKIKPRDYQIEAIEHCLTKRRAVLLSPTGSGKSLIIYMLCRYITEKKKNVGEERKILIVVPIISLVSQMNSDFKDYTGSERLMETHCITAGVTKDVAQYEVVISTWQSLQKQDASWFNQFTGIIIDECHLAKAKSLTTIMERCTNVSYRIGTSGTLDGENVNKLTLTGLFGSVKRVATTTELIEQKQLAPLKINAIVLNYKRTDDIKKIKTYQDEIDYLVSNEKRNKFIVDLVTRLDKTTLVLFRYVESHGVVLHKMMEEQMSDVHYISGKVPGRDRETIRHLMEDNSKKQVLIGSIQTLSTGINIKNIHNIIFTSPTKSQITILQSIGRGLRTHAQKDVLQIYDLVDRFEGKKQNYAVKHFAERVKVYDNELFKYGVKQIEIDKFYK